MRHVNIIWRHCRPAAAWPYYLLAIRWAGRGARDRRPVARTRRNGAAFFGGYRDRRRCSQNWRERGEWPQSGRIGGN